MKFWKDFIKNFLILNILLQGLLMGATIKSISYDGLKIPAIYEKHKTLPIFNLQLIFQNSGYINDKENPGLTNLTAKILNEGTMSDGAVKFARKLESNAISISANSGFETFVIEVSCLKQEYKKALKYLEELLKDPNLTQETLEKVRTLQISKLEQKENDFDFTASNGLKGMIYKDTALAFPSTGTKQSLQEMSLEDIKNNINSIFNLNNLIIAVGGDLVYKDFKEDIKPLLSNFKKHPSLPVKKIDIADKPQNKEIVKETQQSYIYFASPFNIEVNSEDNYKSKVASFILGGSGFGSRLMEEIRVKNGLAYSAYGYITNKKSHSHFTGYLQTKLENTQKAKQMVKDIVKEFVKNGVTKDELKAAKKFLLGSEPLRTETFSQRLNRSFTLYYKGLPMDYPQKELEKIEKLSLEELNDFIKSHKEINQLSFSIVTK